MAQIAQQQPQLLIGGLRVGVLLLGVRQLAKRFKDIGDPKVIARLTG